MLTLDAVAALIDHTLLRADATRRDIEVLCHEAAAARFATVCVNPTWVRFAARQLATTDVKVCTVVAFPLGATPAEVKAFEAARTIDDGAREIDMVINLGTLRSGNHQAVRHELDVVLEECRRGGAHVICKVIIEASALSEKEKRAACEIARAAGVDFVKTSTGLGAGGATVEDVALIRSVVGEKMGIKAAGGIRTLAQVDAMIAAGATRIGTSAGLAILEEARARIS